MSPQSLKRRATSAHAAKSKKVRYEDNQAECSDGSDYEESISCPDSDAEERENNNCATPLTTVSSGSTPRWPSRLKTIPCTYPDCEKTFNRQANLVQHLRSHTNTREFVCPHSPCTKDFLRHSHLQHHIKSAHSEVRDHVCTWPGCSKSFVTGQRLKNHQAVHEGEERFRCEVCGKSFRKHGTLQKHVNIEHEGKKPFVCQLPNEEGGICGAGFMRAPSLRFHQGRVHGEKRFWCTICSPEEAIDSEQGAERVAFSTYAELQAHIGSEHPPKCPECGFQSFSHRELNKHMEIRHGSLGLDERRTHICPEPGCGRGFTAQNNLKVHIKTVHGDRRFICGAVEPSTLKNVEGWTGSDACGISFTSKSNLEEHIRTVHLGLSSSHLQKRKEKENYAPKSLSRKKGNTKSLLHLTGAGYENESGRHISCLVTPCPQRFVSTRDLKSHLKLHHALHEFEIQALLAAAQGERRPALDGSAVYATAEDLEAERALDDMDGDAMEGVEKDLSNGGEERVIRVERSGVGAGIDIEMIDPSLR